MQAAIAVNWRLLRCAVDILRLIVYGYESIIKVYKGGGLTLNEGGGSFGAQGRTRAPY